MVHQMTTYLDKWKSTTNLVADLLSRYFGHPFIPIGITGSDFGVDSITLGALWRQLYMGTEADETIFDDLQIGDGGGFYTLDRRPPGGGIQRYAVLPSRIEIEAVWTKMREFKSQFSHYDDFIQDIVALQEQYQTMERFRESVRKTIRDVDPFVIFPGECPLVGIE